MVFLFEYEIDKELVGDLVKVLLEELDIEFFFLGLIIFKNKFFGLGLELDSCFYI